MLELIKKWLLQPRVSAAIVEAVFAFALYAFDPLGLSSQKALSIDHLVSWFTQDNYVSKTTNTVAVVLIDEDSLNKWKMDWPITYGQTSGLINHLACAGALAVFFDYTLSRKYDLAGDSERLLTVSQNPSKSEPSCMDGKRPNNIPIYFGRVDGLVTPLSDELGRTHQTFSIMAAPSDDTYPVGRTLFPTGPVSPDQMSPAFAMVRELCGHAESAEREIPCPHDFLSRFPTEPLVLRWSGEINPAQGLVTDIASCRGKLPWWQMPSVALGLSSESYFQPCPPILTLSARDLYRDYNYISLHGDPARVLGGRVVFVGTRLAGLNDVVWSPVHASLPGVYKHAVAFDNILSFGARFPTVPTRSGELTLVLLYYCLVELVSLVAKENFTWVRGEANARLISFAAVTVPYGILFVVNRWPASILVVAISYYLGVDFLSALSRLPRRRRTRGDRFMR